jgi:F-type H+-transporting ATPase subunit gamma
VAQARELRRRIKSVQSTRQITKTMEMVATSKLKRAQDRVVAARPYAAALADVLADLDAPAYAERFPLLRQPEGGVRRAALVLITANRGLCGGFNANLIREARRRMQDLKEQGAEVALHLIGRKGVSYFRFARQPIASQRIDIGDRPTPEQAAEVVAPLVQAFEQGALDAVDVVAAQFNSPVSAPPVTRRILPVEASQPAGRDGAPLAFYILRPSAETILEQLLPLYVRNQMFRALVETAAGFQGAQRTAMKNATDSAGEILDVLTRTYNRARQAQITQELAEIVGGAEALKG